LIDDNKDDSIDYLQNKLKKYIKSLKAACKNNN